MQSLPPKKPPSKMRIIIYVCLGLLIAGFICLWVFMGFLRMIVVAADSDKSSDKTTAASADSPTSSGTAVDKQVEIMKQLNLLNAKIAKEGREPTSAERAELDAKIQQLAKLTDPQTAARIKDSLVMEQKLAATANQLNLLGGVDFGTMKSKADLAKRLDLVKQEEGQVNQMLKDFPNTEVAELKLKQLEIMQWQLQFVETHWNQRKIGKGGIPYLDLTDADRKTFDQKGNEYDALQAQATKEAVNLAKKQNPELDKLKKVIDAAQ